MSGLGDIAVIIPVHNGADRLPFCLRSIRRAGKRVAEIIIVDDGSTDASLFVAYELAAMDRRVKVLHTGNQGSYMARLTGIRAASSPFVAFLDADDWYYEGALDRLADLLDRYEADIAFGGITKTREYEVFPEDEESSLSRQKSGVDPLEERACGGIDFPDDRALQSCRTGISNHQIRVHSPEDMWPRIMKWRTQEFLCYVWHKLYRRELFDGLPELVGVCQGDDVLLTCKAFLRARCIVETTKPVYLYYVNPEGLTHSGFSDRDLDLIRVWDEAVALFEIAKNAGDRNYPADMEPELAWLARYNRWRTDLTLISRLALAGDAKADRQYAQELKKWRAGLKEHWRELVLAHGMPRSREILVLAFRFLYLPTKVLLRVGRRVSGEDAGILVHSGDQAGRDW